MSPNPYQASKGVYTTLLFWEQILGVKLQTSKYFAFACQEWNEMHHLKIMESLGGDLEWVDRFFGQHAAFFYYWV